MTRWALALQHTRPACGDAGAKAAVGRRVSDAGGRVPDVDSGAAIVEVTGGEGVEGVAAVIVPLHTQHVRPCANPQHASTSTAALRVWTASRKPEVLG